MGYSIGEGLTIGSQFFGGISSMRSQTKQYIAQVKAQSKKFNFDIQALRMQRRDLYEQAVEEMTKIRMNQHSLASSVQAGLNENFVNGGRTARALERSLQGDEDRAVFSTREGYSKGIQQLNYQTGLTIENTKNNINSIAKPNNYVTALQTAISMFGTAQQVENREKMLSVYDMETDKYGRAVSKAQLQPETMPNAERFNRVLGGTGFSYSGSNSYLFNQNLTDYLNNGLSTAKDWLGGGI